MISNRLVSEMVERDRHAESCPLHWLPKGHAGAKCWCNLASSQAPSDAVVIQAIAQVLWEKVGPAITAARAADIARDIFAAIPPAGGVEEIAQSDRVVAAAIVLSGAPGVGNGNKIIADEIKGGLHDDYRIVQLIAEHRRAALTLTREGAPHDAA